MAGINPQTYMGFHRGVGDPTHQFNVELLVPGEGTATFERALHFAQAAARDTDWNVAANAHPTLYIHSTTTPATNYMTFAHDGSNAVINVVGGGLVFNECSTDTDFRVESNGETHMLFVDGGNNQVLAGGAAGPDTTARLVAIDDAAGASGAPFALYSKSASPADNDELVMGFWADDSANAAVELARITIVQEDVTNCTDDAHMAFDIMVNNVFLNDVLKIGAESCAGQASFLFNDDGDDFDFRVESDCNASMIDICGATDNIGIGSAVVTGAFMTVIGSAQARDVVTSVGTMLHFPADIHTDGNCTGTIVNVADIFVGIKTYNGGAAMTFTNLSSIYLEGPPVANTCVTATTLNTMVIATGSLAMGIVGGTAPTIDFHGSTDSISKFAAGASPANLTYTLPQTDPCGCTEQLQATSAGVMAWASAGSLREIKDLQGLTCKNMAYDNIVGANVYDFTYKEEFAHKVLGAYTPHPFTGIVSDEAPWAMMGKKLGTFSPISAFGQLTAAFQVLDAKVKELEYANAA